MLPLTGKSKILLTLASKYINIFYLSLISIKKNSYLLLGRTKEFVCSHWYVRKKNVNSTGKYPPKKPVISQWYW